MTNFPRLLLYHILHPSNFAGGKHYFYAVRMEVGAGEEAFYKSFGEFSGALVVLLHNFHKVAGFDVFSVSSVHIFVV